MNIFPENKVSPDHPQDEVRGNYFIINRYLRLSSTRPFSFLASRGLAGGCRLRYRRRGGNSLLIIFQSFGHLFLNGSNTIGITGVIAEHLLQSTGAAR
jgi:hypothetical protein